MAQFTLTIYAAFKEDINSGWVWLAIPTLPPRCVVKITNRVTSQSAYCEALQIDENYLTAYNQLPRKTISQASDALIVNEWYRTRLGCMQTQMAYSLEVESVNNPFGKLMACLQHPQVVVRLATWLGILGLALGFVGVTLGVAAL